jgi:hypothetical protein
MMDTPLMVKAKRLLADEQRQLDTLNHAMALATQLTDGTLPYGLPTDPGRLQKFLLSLTPSQLSEVEGLLVEVCKGGMVQPETA